MDLARIWLAASFYRRDDSVPVLVIRRPVVPSNCKLTLSHFESRYFFQIDSMPCLYLAARSQSTNLVNKELTLAVLDAVYVGLGNARVAAIYEFYQLLLGDRSPDCAGVQALLPLLAAVAV